MYGITTEKMLISLGGQYLFDWDKALRINNLEEKVSIFNDPLMNMIQKFVLMKLSNVMTETHREQIKK